MSDYESQCAIWETPAHSVSNPSGKDGDWFDSPRTGGEYFIVRTAKAMIGSEDFTVDDRLRLTSWLVSQRSQGDKCPEISSNTVNHTKLLHKLSFIKREIKLLECLNSIQSSIDSGIVVKQPWVDFRVFKMAAWSESETPREVDYLLLSLKERDMISYKKPSNMEWVILIKPEGYYYLDESKRNITLSEQAFIAMWFNDKLKDARDKGIKLGITDAGYSPYIVDEDQFLENIDDKIIAEIRRSRFLVADFTQNTCKDFMIDFNENEKLPRDKKVEVKVQNYGARGGVYFEAGFAYGLGIPVIHTCRADCVDLLHFDIRQRPHIVWKTPGDLRAKLATKISALIGEGPLKEQVQAG